MISARFLTKHSERAGFYGAKRKVFHDGMVDEIGEFKTERKSERENVNVYHVA